MKQVALATHTATVNGKPYDGIGNSLKDTLNPICDDYIFVRHSMDGAIRSEVQAYKNGKMIKTNGLGVLKKPSPLRYVSEIVGTLIYFIFRKKVDIYIGVDPLNAIAGILLKKIKRVDMAVFYTADYSESRFGNGLMDGIYHHIDQYCVKNADEVWSVSSKITDIRTNMGLSDSKNIFVPNAPPVEYSHLRKNKHDRYNLITAGIIDRQLDYEGVIRAVAALTQKYPKMTFTVIGNGPEEARLKDLAGELGITKKIIFTGRLPLAETLEKTSKAGIGLAPYTGIWGFNQYGDSTKCREYFTFGLPVISTDTHSTVGEIREYEAGIVTEPNVEAYIKAIEEILSCYGMYSKKSLELGKKYEGVHKKQLLRILED